VDKLRAMRAFVKVANACSFAKAAALLDISVPMMSRLILSLEDDLGTRLLNRTTRKVSLTQAGVQFHEDCQQLLDEFDEVWTATASRQKQMGGILRIGTPTIFGVNQLAAIVAAYRSLHPQAVVDILLVDRPIDLVEEQLDLCIVPARYVTATGVVARPITTIERYTCASPAYLARHAPPEHPSELSHHAWLAFRPEHHDAVITFNDHAGNPVKVTPNVAMLANNLGMLRESAIAGLGIAMLPAYLVSDDILGGRLCRLLTDYPVANTEFRIVYSTRRHLNGKAKEFIKLTIEHFDSTAFPSSTKFVFEETRLNPSAPH
jgi:DNA-binding transcriptional LysR family regulator